MKKMVKTLESSMLYRKIDELGLTAVERTEAIAALESADKLVEATFRVFEKLRQITGRLAPNPQLKHQ